MKYLLVIYCDTFLDRNKSFYTLKEVNDYIKEHNPKRYAIYKLVKEN